MEKKRLLEVLQQAAELGLCVVIIGIPISNATVSIGLGFLWFFWGLRKLITRDFSLPKGPVTLLFGLFVVSALISITHTINPAASAGGMRKLLKAFMLFWAVADTVRSPRACMRFFWAASAGCLLVSIDGLYQYFRGVDFLRGNAIAAGLHYGGVENVRTFRLTASMRGPNEYGTYLATFLGFLFPVALYGLSGRRKILFLVLSALSAFCFMNTHFRGGAAAVFLTILLLGLVKRDRRILIGIVLVLAAIPFMLPKDLLFWASSHLNPYDFFVEEGGRRWHWQAALNMIRAHPWAGVGVNTFSLNYDAFKSPADPLSGYYAHNSYLHVAAEIGLPGLVFLLAIIVFVIFNGWKLYRTGADVFRRSLGLGLTFGFLAFSLSAVMDTSLQSSNLVALFWCFAGLIVGLSRMQWGAPAPKEA